VSPIVSSREGKGENKKKRKKTYTGMSLQPQNEERQGHLWPSIHQVTQRRNGYPRSKKEAGEELKKTTLGGDPNQPGKIPVAQESASRLTGRLSVEHSSTRLKENRN